MSGTSMDGIDAALVSFPDAGKVELHDSSNTPYSNELRDSLEDLISPDWTGSLSAIAQLDHQVGQAFALAANTLIKRNSDKSVAAIGSHGQTVFHDPLGESPTSWQLGDANIIAEKTNCHVVSDFRRRDIAAGGQGAPLAPGFHHYLCKQQGGAILNLGGIANITLVDAEMGSTIGFDTGPANTLMDNWCKRHTGDDFDNEGQWARQGQLNHELLATMLADDYFSSPPPKSTGRERFNLQWLDRLLDASHTDLSPEDTQRTLCELTAKSVADALKPLISKSQTDQLLLCGGGSKNTFLRERLQAHLPALKVQPIAELGLDADYLEAMAFAWLARQTMLQRGGNIISVTGARSERVLGAIYSPAPKR